MNQKLLIVNKNDEVIGLDTKENCHSGNGILHRAITIFIIKQAREMNPPAGGFISERALISKGLTPFIFNEKNEILLTKRSSLKKLWPEFWDTSCSTHVRQNETYEQAGERRLSEELGFSCKLKFIFKFQYQANFQNIGSENEICALLIGNYAGDINPNLNEVSEYKWIDLAELKREINSQNNYSPWLKIAVEKYLKSGSECMGKIAEILPRT